MALEDRYSTQPFQEAIDYLLGKINLPTDSWRDLLDDEHDAFFMSAGAKGSILSDLAQATTQAISEGWSLEEFSKRFDTIAEGWADMRGDRDWRARIVFQTNLRQAYAAGRYEYQLDPEVVAIQPYLQYIHSDSAQPRPSHIALDGLVFPANELPFYPPDGYGCGCRTISLSQRDLDRAGLSVSELRRGDTATYDFDGKTEQAVLEPEPGFDYIPGQASRGERRVQVMAEVVSRLEGPIREQVMADINAYQQENIDG